MNFEEFNPQSYMNFEELNAQAKRVTLAFQYKIYSTDGFILSWSHAREATEVF